MLQLQTAYTAAWTSLCRPAPGACPALVSLAPAQFVQKYFNPSLEQAAASPASFMLIVYRSSRAEDSIDVEIPDEEVDNVKTETETTTIENRETTTTLMTTTSTTTTTTTTTPSPNTTTSSTTTIRITTTEEAKPDFGEVAGGAACSQHAACLVYQAEGGAEREWAGQVLASLATPRRAGLSVGTALLSPSAALPPNTVAAVQLAGGAGTALPDLHQYTLGQTRWVNYRCLMPNHSTSIKQQIFFVLLTE